MKRQKIALREAVIGVVLLHELPELASIQLAMHGPVPDAELPLPIARRLRRALVTADGIDSALRRRAIVPPPTKKYRGAYWTVKTNWELVQRVAGQLEADPFSKVTLHRAELAQQEGASHALY